jgi:subtilase family serine protease
MSVIFRTFLRVSPHCGCQAQDGGNHALHIRGRLSIIPVNPEHRGSGDPGEGDDMRGIRLRQLALATGAVAFAAMLSAAAVATAKVSGSTVPARTVLAGSKPAWATAAPQTAAVPAAQAGVTARVWLAPRSTGQLDALAAAVSDPSSPQYGQFLSEAAYRAQFAPTADQVAQVRAWLAGAGLKVTAVGPDNHFVAASGSAAAANAAFGTQLARYSVNGATEQAPSSDLSVPEAVAGLVEAVTGLAPFGHDVAQSDLGPPPAYVDAPPCPAYYGEQTASTLPKFRGKKVPWATCGYVPAQLRGAYDVPASAGAGATVAITDAYDSPTLLSDANTYAGRRGDPPFAAGQFSDRSVPEDDSTGPDCGGNGWYQEQSLDVEAVHGMAPAAGVLYYGAASCNDADLLAVLAQVVADNDASIITNSWGEPHVTLVDGKLVPVIDKAEIKAYESVFKQAIAQGIGIYFSSGDEGDEFADVGHKQTDWPAEDPWVTAVGGTSLAIGQDNTRQFETGWGTAAYFPDKKGKSWQLASPFIFGSGGGFSELFSRPWYQNGVVPSNTSGRGVPDVSMDGDPTTGMLVGQTEAFTLPSIFGPPGNNYGEYDIGGTSLSSPLFAGVQAVAQGSARIGFANPMLYHLASRPGNWAWAKHGKSSSPFFDVTPQGDAGNAFPFYLNNMNADDGVGYELNTFNEDSSLVTGPGWDDVTGIGSITGQYFAAVAAKLK